MERLIFGLVYCTILVLSTTTTIPEMAAEPKRRQVQEKQPTKQEKAIALRVAVRKALTDIIEQVKTTLSYFRNSDYDGKNGLNEAGFKFIVIAEARKLGFEIFNEHQIEGGYIDLVLTKEFDDAERDVFLILELKYIRGGFIKVANGKSIRYSSFYRDLYEIHNKMGKNLVALTKQQILDVSYQAFKDGTAANEKVQDLMKKTIDTQLLRYIKAAGTGGIGKLDGEIFGLVIIGVANTLTWSIYKNNN